MLSARENGNLSDGCQELDKTTGRRGPHGPESRLGTWCGRPRQALRACHARLGRYPDKGKPQAGGNAHPGGLSQTGDTQMMTIVVLGGAGVAAVCAAVALRGRGKRDKITMARERGNNRLSLVLPVAGLVTRLSVLGVLPLGRDVGGRPPRAGRPRRWTPL